MQAEVYSLGATQVVVGLSALVSVRPQPYQIAVNVKIYAGGGTLEITPIPVALSGSSAIGWGKGYVIGANEVVSVGGPAQFYLAATGATMTVSLLPSYTSGVSLI